MKFLKISSIFILIFATTVFAQMPPPPSDFWGTIKINGADAPVGTVITPTINNVAYPTPFTVAESPGAGQYGMLSVNGDIASTAEIKEGGVNGETIVFKATFNATEYTLYPSGTWQSGSTTRLDLTDQSQIPVELSSFKANVSNSDVQLTWTTETETNNFGFEIQRSSDKINFRLIGFKSGHGTTSFPHHYQFTDSNLASGEYNYRLKQIDSDGSFIFSDKIFVALAMPFKYDLQQNYPNPFNPTTTIWFSIPQDEKVTVNVYDVTGRFLINLVDSFLHGGTFFVEWDEKDINGKIVCNGLYLYRITAGKYTNIKKMIFGK